MSLGLVKNPAEVYQMLHLIGVPSLLTFDHDGCADDARSSGNVDQESFVWPWHHHDRRLCKEQLELLKSCVCLLRPGKMLGGFKEFEER